MWYEGESCIGLPAMFVPPGPNMRFVVDWLEGPDGELEKPVESLGQHGERGTNQISARWCYKHP